MRRCFVITILLSALLSVLDQISTAEPLDSGFTYQGHLQRDGSPVNGVVHIRFSLWDSPGGGQPPVGGNQLGVSQLLTNIPVSDGVFTVVLNASQEFGVEVLNGEKRWLQIEICADTGCASLNILSPRQPLVGTPYSLNSVSAPWTGLTGIPEGFADGVDNVSGTLWEESGADIVYTTGKVGIGSASPHHQLRVSGGPIWTTAGWLGSLELDNIAAIGWRGNAGGQRFGIGQTNGGLFFFRTPSDPGATDAPATYDLTIGDTGRVGIGPGATAPAYPLTINSGGVAGYGWVHTDGTVEVGSYTNSSGGWLGTRSNHPLYFFTNDSAPKVTIDTDGDVGVGTSTPDDNARVDVRANGQFESAIIATSVDGNAVRGTSNSNGGVAILGVSENNGSGVKGVGKIGIDGAAFNAGDTAVNGFAVLNALAGRFVGSVDINGTLYKSDDASRIDHPLDPANKFLLHSSVESSERMNIYNGNITTDADGFAEVTLPEWFESLNTEFRYQLTVIGQFAQAIVEKRIEKNRFSIRTDKGNVDVSWQVTGVRQDAYAKAHAFEVEKVKPEGERGKYLTPELFGQPKEMGIHHRYEPQVSSISESSQKDERN